MARSLKKGPFADASLLKKVDAFIASTFFNRLSSANGPFFNDLAIRFVPPYYR